MNFLTKSLLVFAVAGVAVAEESGLRGRELTETTYCIDNNALNADRSPWYRRIKWTDAQKASGSNADKIVDMSICEERLDVKKRYCINNPRNEQEFNYQRPNWNLQTAESPNNAAKIVDDAICTEYLNVKQRYCVLSPPRAKHAHLQPAMVHTYPNWNLQTATFNKDLIIDKAICEVKKDYCVKYGAEEDPKYRRRSWKIHQAESRGNYPKIVELSICEEQERLIAEEKERVRLEKERLKAEAREAREAEKLAREKAAHDRKMEIVAEKERRKAEKEEKDALRKEILISKDIDAAEALLKEAVDLQDAREEHFEEAEDQFDDGEITKFEFDKFKRALDYAKHDTKHASRLVERIEKALQREAENQRKKAEKAARRAKRQAGKRARMEARKKAQANRRRGRRGKGKFPPREDTCFKDHICARVSGDPHITTFDGLRYDCQGHGEFVLVRDLNSGFEVQGRFEDARTNTDGNMITITKAIAVDTGVVVDGVDVPSVDIVAEETDAGEDGACTINYYIDGKPANFGAKGSAVDRNGKPVAEATPFVDENGTVIPGIELYDNGNSDQLYFPDSGFAYSVFVRYGNFGCVLNNDFCMPKTMAGDNIVGLFGSPNRNKADDWMKPDGSIYNHGGDLSDEHGYSYCTQTWCVTEAESIFGYLEDEEYADFYGCDRPYNKNKPSVIIGEATEECQSCCAPITDVAVKNDCLLECMEGDVVDCQNFKVVEEEFNQELQCSVEPKSLTDPPPVKTTTPDPLTEDDITTPNTFVKGDPHFKTFGGELYDYHGECDLVLLHNPEFKNNLGMDIHIRTKIENFWSSVESAALRIGDETVEIRADPESEEWLWINGEAARGDVGKWHRASIAGFLVRYKSSGKNREAVVYLEGDAEPLQLRTFKNFVHVNIQWQGSENFSGSTGLLGSHAHNGARLGRDGKFIEDLNAFGQDWQVTAEEPQLFHSYEGAVLLPNKCVLPPAMGEQVALRKRRLAEGMDVAVAEKACAHLGSSADRKACVFDVIATQDTAMASVW